MKPLTLFLKQKRLSQNLTLRGLSDMAGISISHLSKVERGDAPLTNKMVNILTEYLKLTDSEIADMLNKNYKTADTITLDLTSVSEDVRNGLLTYLNKKGIKIK